MPCYLIQQLLFCFLITDRGLVFYVYVSLYYPTSSHPMTAVAGADLLTSGQFLGFLMILYNCIYSVKQPGTCYDVKSYFQYRDCYYEDKRIMGQSCFCNWGGWGCEVSCGEHHRLKVYALCSGGHFKNAYELLNLRALKMLVLYKNHIFQCAGKIFCVESKGSFEICPIPPSTIW